MSLKLFHHSFHFLYWRHYIDIDINWCIGDFDRKFIAATSNEHELTFSFFPKRNAYVTKMKHILKLIEKYFSYHSFHTINWLIVLHKTLKILLSYMLFLSVMFNYIEKVPFLFVFKRLDIKLLPVIIYIVSNCLMEENLFLGSFCWRSI